MAVDVIPGPSKELMAVLCAAGTVRKLTSQIKVDEENIKMLRTIGNLAKVHLKELSQIIRDVQKEIKYRKYKLVIWEEIVKELPALCSYCKGKRSRDNSMSRMMATICSFCDGTGLAKSSRLKFNYTRRSKEI